MNLTNKIVLITGGSAGIGYAIAKTLTGNGNRIIITGRSKERLEKAAATLKDVKTIVSDVTNSEDVDKLVTTVSKEFGGLDILVNNAGLAFGYMLNASADAYTKARAEMETNYFAPIRITEKFLPLLQQSKEAAIVNISSVASFISVPFISTYSATKAALHSYTVSLRLTLEQAAPNIRVFEIMPPYVDTDFARGVNVEKMSADEVAADTFKALQENKVEVRNGIAEPVYHQYLANPEGTVRAFNSAKN